MDELHARARRRSMLFLWLMLAITCQLGFAFAYLSNATGGIQFLLFILGCASLGAISTFWFADRIVLAATGARIVTDAQEPRLHAIIDEMAIAAGLPKPKVAIVEDPTLNAFATGRNPQHSLIAVNRGLLQSANERQLRGVIAHEMSHILNSDMLVSTVGSVMVTAVAGLANVLTVAGLEMAAQARIQSQRARTQEQRNNANSSAMMGMGLAAIGGLLSVTFVPLLGLLSLAMGRSRETLADISGAHLCKDPGAIAEVFELMQQSTQVSANSSMVASALMINEPTRLRAPSLAERIWSSHPPLATRIATMRSIERGQSYTAAASTAGAAGSGALLSAVLATVLLVAPSAALAARSASVSSGSNDPGTYSQVPAPVDTGMWGWAEPTPEGTIGPEASDLELVNTDDSVLRSELVYTVEIRTSSNGLVTFATTTGRHCSVDQSGQVSFRRPGTCLIQVSQAADANWLASPMLTFTLQILADDQPAPDPNPTEELADQSIIVGDIAQEVPLSDGTYVLDVYGSYTHELTYATLTPSTCSVASGEVTLLAVGTCSIGVTSPAFYIFKDAEPVTVSFTITPDVTVTP